MHSEKPRLQFYIGFLAAIAWAVYSVLTRKISELGRHTIQTIRRVFGYGLLFMLPLFLGLGASALCFVTWNTAVKLLGAVRTSVYIYLVPVVTVAAADLGTGFRGRPHTCGAVAVGNEIL